jgi:hypothetical protein
MRIRSSLAFYIVICVACGAADADRYAVDRLPELLGDTSSRGPYIEVDIASGPMAEWTLAETLAIGSSADGEDEGQADFFQVITDVQLLSDGRIAVLDPSAASVRIYRDDGALDAVLGREGDGPGEFRFPENVRECVQGEYHALEGSNNRLKVFAADGSFQREFRLFGHNPNGPLWSWDCADGVTLTMQWGDGDNRVGEIGRFRKQVPLAVSGPDGQVIETLGRILGPERYRYENRGTGPAPLGAVTGLAIHDGTIYVAEGPAIRVDLFSLSGNHLRSLAADLPPRPADPAAYVRSQRSADMTAEETRAFNARWRDWDFPEMLPDFRVFIVDDDGSMWIERYPIPGDQTTTWWVVDPEGSWRATVEVPGNVVLLDVAEGRAAGVRRGELDVESAVVFEIRTEASDGGM